MLAESFTVAKATIERLMQEMGLKAKSKIKFKIKTTDSSHRYPVADNLLNRQFNQRYQ